jgi:hypothetical protein
MRVLGFDIGIKNLAFCIVEKHGTDYVIPKPVNIHWNIIDIIKEDICCAVEGCDADVKKFTNVNGERAYFCGKHARKEHKKLCEKHPVNKYLLETKEKCTQIKSCKGTACCKMNGTYLCDKHDKIVTKQLAKERSLQDYKLIITEKYSNDDLKERLVRALDSHKDLFMSVDQVRIEAQPMFVSCKVKLISDTLAAWFFIRGLIDKRFNHSHIQSTKYSASTNKLKVSENEQKIKELVNQSTNRYAMTKQMGEVECKLMLHHSLESLEHLDKFKKQDDMCDAYLHAVYCIQRENKSKKNKGMIVPNYVNLQRQFAILNARIHRSIYDWCII